MDRLVCGDVGFGKTEVALRAAFVAVHGGKQVAHAGADHAAGRAALPDHRRPLRQVAGEGGRAVALPLGQGSQGRARRHRRRHASTSSSARTSCCQPDVKFKRLGLLVIDEEHRFGVRHKEAIKAMRAEVDVLTLTATPIPRTLGMALEGLRDLSRDRHRAAAAPGDQDLRAQRRQRHDPRGGAARAEARRPGLLPAQRGRDDPAPAREAAASCCPRRASRSRTARCPSASSSA